MVRASKFGRGSDQAATPQEGHRPDLVADVDDNPVFVQLREETFH
jgi:hypothetical protein